MPIFKAIIKGKDSSIQGIGFRELVEKLAIKSNPAIKGFVKNRVKEEDTEIQCVFKSKEEFESFLEYIKNAAKVKFGIEVEVVKNLSSEKAEKFFDEKLEGEQIIKKMDLMKPWFDRDTVILAIEKIKTFLKKPTAT